MNILKFMKSKIFFIYFVHFLCVSKLKAYDLKTKAKVM